MGDFFFGGKNPNIGEGFFFVFLRKVRKIGILLLYQVYLSVSVIFKLHSLKVALALRKPSPKRKENVFQALPLGCPPPCDWDTPRPQPNGRAVSVGRTIQCPCRTCLRWSFVLQALTRDVVSNQHFGIQNTKKKHIKTRQGSWYDTNPKLRGTNFFPSAKSI